MLQSNHFSKLRGSHQDALRQLNRSQAISSGPQKSTSSTNQRNNQLTRHVSSPVRTSASKKDEQLSSPKNNILKLDYDIMKQMQKPVLDSYKKDTNAVPISGSTNCTNNGKSSHFLLDPMIAKRYKEYF